MGAPQTKKLRCLVCMGTEWTGQNYPHVEKRKKKMWYIGPPPNSHIFEWKLCWHKKTVKGDLMSHMVNILKIKMHLLCKILRVLVWGLSWFRAKAHSSHIYICICSSAMQMHMHDSEVNHAYKRHPGWLFLLMKENFLHMWDMQGELCMIR